MKRYIKSLFLAAATLAVFASCAKEDKNAGSEAAGKPLVIAPSFGNTRAVNYSIDTYFGLSGYESATVTVNGTAAKYSYIGGVLSAATGVDPFLFPVDGSSIATLKVEWPESSVRAASLATDQSTKESFLTSDWLSVTLTNVAPTLMLPVQMLHENAKVEFKLSDGRSISALSINGYSAYCEAGKTEAQLILAPVAAGGIMPAQTGDSGTLKVDGESGSRTFTLTDFPSELAAGSNYTITLNI